MTGESDAISSMYRVVFEIVEQVLDVDVSCVVFEVVEQVLDVDVAAE